MTTKKLFLILLITQSISLFAQDPMVAYRREGIWYYFNTDGKPMWEAFADVASFPNGWNKGLLKAQRMEITGTTAENIRMRNQQVLYDATGNVIFVPKLEGLYRIVSNADKAGFIHIISSETEHLILCDKTGKVVFECANETGQYVGDGVVAYLKTSEEMAAEGEKNYILYDVKAKKVLATVVCSGLFGDFEEGAIFCHNEKFNWGMVNRQGKMTQPMVWNSDFYEESYKPIQSNTGFFILIDAKTQLKSLLNKNGEILVKDMSEVMLHSKDYLSCIKGFGEKKSVENYVLEGTHAKLIDKEKGTIYFSLDGDFVVGEDAKHDLIVMDKKLKSIAKIKSFKYSAIEIFKNHFWTQTDSTNDHSFTCYNAQGIKTGTIEAEKWGKSSYGHVPFMKNDLWGLATESGKVVIKPTFTFKDDNIPDVNKGFWCIPKQISDDNTQFDFYNFQGKLVMSTTSEKDGWDYIVPQEEVLQYRNN